VASRQDGLILAAMTLAVIATTFFMHAMVWHYFRQLKMPRPDACRSPIDSTGASTSPTWSCNSSWTSVAARPHLGASFGMLDFVSNRMRT